MRSLRSTVIAVVVICFAAGLLAQSVANHNSAAGRLARGQYLVDHVSKCGDCHTPRDEKGLPITSKYLQGGDLGVQPVAPNPVFTRIVPDISAKGLTGWGVADLSKAFQIGKRPNGEMFRPPMPAYTMRREDADAIAFYLKSLK